MRVRKNKGLRTDFPSLIPEYFSYRVWSGKHDLMCLCLNLPIEMGNYHIYPKGHDSAGTRHAVMCQLWEQLSGAVSIAVCASKSKAIMQFL